MKCQMWAVFLTGSVLIAASGVVGVVAQRKLPGRTSTRKTVQAALRVVVGLVLLVVTVLNR
jgi:hypothetical protein